MSQLFQRAAICVGLLCLTACVGSDAAKETSAKAASLLKSYEAEATSTLKTQRTAEEKILQNISQLSKESIGAQGRLDAIIASWKIAGDKASLDSYAAITGRKAEEVIAASPVLSAQTAKSETAVPRLSQDYGPADKALVDLRKFGSAKSRLEFLASVLGKIAEQAGDAGVIPQ